MISILTLEEMSCHVWGSLRPRRGQSRSVLNWTGAQGFAWVCHGSLPFPLYF